ncbi:unnamed protein product [Oppiella nova]|uniref:Neurotransmitter-gated ion-channel ligand-binding domain-containing protein n=1 Tax=Oppiella nova TaxID=334625 RepID=A0A7R9M975_9ACAR|nr:unnamed protein product [Oppiella nova]CAG2173117.1 unnamed protein product [Oppiella nova]
MNYSMKGLFLNGISDVSQILHKLTNNGYDKNIRPNYGVLPSGAPVGVNITMYINDISAVSEVMMDYTLDFYIRQLWTDERLTYNSTTVSQLILGAEFAKKIWIPDTFFINGKQVSLHISTTTDSKT